MKDWQAMVRAAETLLTLDEAERAARLKQLALDAEARQTVEGLVARSRRPQGFLRTSMTLVEPEEHGVPRLQGHIGERIGPWELEACIGQGGMGEVWRARRADGLYDQQVALKLMQRSDAAWAERFDAERRRLARMQHPGIARIVDGGMTADGRPYMAMDLVDGVPIDVHVQGMDLRRVVRLLIGVCQSIQHAHGRLVLHRDIKAANVLVDETGTARLIDFGIASELAEADTVGGPVTLGYAAPEQLQGEPVSVATDIFQLGMLAHQLLTGHLPARNADASVTVGRADGVSEDLRAILKQAVAARPEERYASAAAMGEDLKAWLDRRPVQARQGGWAYRSGRMIARYPFASGFAVLALVALTTGLMTSLKFAADARTETQRTREALAEAEYQFEYANANLLGQNTYGTILYELFAEEGREQALTDTLLARWQRLHEDRERIPDLAAATSFVLGRNFFLRRDHVNAQAVLGPWLTHRYGPDSLLAHGRELYAMSLFESGRRTEALPEMREVMASFEQGHRRAVSAQLNFALRLATLTNLPADIDKAEALYHARELEQTADERTPAQVLNSLPALLHIRRLRGDDLGAIDVAREMVAIYETNPDYRFGRTLARINLGELLLFATDNATDAEAAARAVIGLDRTAEGESAVTARGYYLLARSLMAQSRLAEAAEALAEGRRLQERYTGTPGGGPDYDLVEAQLAAGRGDVEGARRLLQQASAGTATADTALVAALIALVEGQAVTTVAEGLQAVIPSAATLNHKQKHLYRRLRALGLPELADAAQARL